MKKTLNIDAELLAEARTISGAATDTETIHQGLQALVQRAAYERLASYREPGGQGWCPAARCSSPTGQSASGGGALILADTSVWIRSFLNRPGFAAALKVQLLNDQIAGHEFVHGELLMGDTGARGPFLRDYERLRWAPKASHADVVTLARQRKLTGRGLGWIDLHLLAAARSGGLGLWTADERLAAVAAELRIGWQP